MFYIDVIQHILGYFYCYLKKTTKFAKNWYFTFDTIIFKSKLKGNPVKIRSYARSCKSNLFVEIKAFSNLRHCQYCTDGKARNCKTSQNTCQEKKFGNKQKL